MSSSFLLGGYPGKRITLVNWGCNPEVHTANQMISMFFYNKKEGPLQMLETVPLLSRPLWHESPPLRGSKLRQELHHSWPELQNGFQHRLRSSMPRFWSHGSEILRIQPSAEASPTQCTQCVPACGALCASRLSAVRGPLATEHDYRTL